MLLLLTLASLSGIARPLSTVQISMCCCGCTSDPCPNVGSSCPVPKQECRTPTDLKCTDLQMIREELRTIGVNGNPLNRKDDTSENGNTTSLHEQVRLVTNDGLTIIERGSGGKSEWKDVVAPVHPESIPQMLLNIFPLRENNVMRATNTSSFQSGSHFSPIKLAAPITETSNAMDKTIKDKATFEKLEAIVAELQKMLHQVKQSTLDTTNERSDVSFQEEGGATSVDLAVDELEKKAIDDVIARMRGSFDKTTREVKSMDEVDSSVPVAAVDAQSSLQHAPPHIRVIRESRGDGDRNCNDARLKEIIVKNIEKDAQTSKRAIQKAAESEFGGTFDVICSPCEFSFVITSQKYCDGFKDQIACFVFLQPPTPLTSH